MTDLLLSPLISRGMIMQRETPFPVWTGKKAAVIFLGKKYESREASGKWLTILDPAEAGGPHIMEIVCDTGSLSIEDIYIGDVWLCGGQSNMEMPMQRLSDDYSEEWEYLKSVNRKPETGDQIAYNDSFNYPVIRQFMVTKDYDFISPQSELKDGSWLRASLETLHEFSAAAWFFAKNAREKYGAPVGLINAAWGGTPIETWMSCESLKDFPEKIAAGRQYASAAKRGEITSKNNAAINEWETRLKYDDTGLTEGWQNPDTKISEWDEITLPGDFSTAGLTDFCGVIWLAKDIETEADFERENVKVWLGTIVDADTVYINGKEIGNTTYRYPPRKYIPRGLLKRGKNRIVIRVTCNKGDGGVTSGKPFRVFSDNETVELSGTWKYKTAVSTQARPEEFFIQRQPMGGFNAMIAPVLKFPLKGVLWYQGESNDFYPYDYEKLFLLMIDDWRKKYNEQALLRRDKKETEGILPFFFVQLPIWKKASDNDESSSWAVIREAQKNALTLPLTGMAAALELGEWNDLHPVNKKDIGYRLFLAAEKVLAGVNNASPGPVIKEHGISIKDNKIYLSFDNCKEGLCILDDSPVINITTNAFLRTLEIDEPSQDSARRGAYVSVTADEGQIRLPAEITSPDTISVDISSVKKPKMILYAWADNPRDRQFFNSEGLPMIPFKIKIPKGD